MYHVPIVDTDDVDFQIEFCHINADAKAGTWKKEDIICLENIKINVFMEGEFSVIANDQCYRPAYGDICVLPPYQMHCGQILRPTHTDYYQLDIGIKAFDHIPHGKEFTQKVILTSMTNGLFFRPSKTAAKTILQLCDKLENTIRENNAPLSYACTIEILSEINNVCAESRRVSTFVLSKVTKDTIQYIEDHFEKNIKIEALSARFGISASYLSRLFKKEVGVGIHEYLTKYRILQSTYLLKEHSVTEVCYMCGFSDSSHFISVFKKHFGITPSTYKKERHKN